MAGLTHRKFRAATLPASGREECRTASRAASFALRGCHWHDCNTRQLWRILVGTFRNARDAKRFFLTEPEYNQAAVARRRASPNSMESPRVTSNALAPGHSALVLPLRSAVDDPNASRLSLGIIAAWFSADSDTDDAGSTGHFVRRHFARRCCDWRLWRPGYGGAAAFAWTPSSEGWLAAD